MAELSIPSGDTIQTYTLNSPRLDQAIIASAPNEGETIPLSVLIDRIISSTEGK